MCVTPPARTPRSSGLTPIIPTGPFRKTCASVSCSVRAWCCSAILVTLVVWQGSFNFGPFAPSSMQQTDLFWAVSTLIFILTITLGFILFRTGLKLYIERQSNRPGSHIKSKLIGGAIALSVLPVFFLVLWSVSVLNRNLENGSAARRAT